MFPCWMMMCFHVIWHHILVYAKRHILVTFVPHFHNHIIESATLMPHHSSPHQCISPIVTSLVCIINNTSSIAMHQCVALGFTCYCFFTHAMSLSCHLSAMCPHVSAMSFSMPVCTPNCFKFLHTHTLSHAHTPHCK